MVCVSKPEIEVIQQCGSDDIIARAAWVSTGSDGVRPSTLEEGIAYDKKVKGLIKFLLNNKHGSPFEHCFLTIRVKASIFLFREWHRHRIGFSYNELSARYTVIPPEFYIPPLDRPSFKIEGWKASSPKFLTLDEIREKDAELANSKETSFIEWIEKACDLYEQTYELYKEGLDLELDPGLARMILPQGMQTVCWVSCNPRSIMNFLSLRTHDETAKHVSYPLYEINEAANILEEIFKEYWPITYEAFCNNGRVSP